MFQRSTFLFTLLACAALYAAQRLASQIRPAVSNLGVRIEGSFKAGGGWYPGEPFVTARPVRAWGSWAGSDENTGTLTLGPFVAESRVRLAVGGYPARNKLFLVHVVSGARQSLVTADVGERWRIVDFPVPAGWIGTPIKVVAIDDSKSLGGWLAVTEPVHGGPGDPYAALWQTFAAWSVNALLLGVLWIAASHVLAPRMSIAPAWLPLVAGAAVALAGYAVFWAYFLAPFAGHVVTIGVFLWALWSLLRPGISTPAAAAEMRTVGQLAVVIGAFYLGLLHLFPSSLDFYGLAANRFRPGLPGDNILPHVIAQRLFEGANLRVPLGDWLSSDRPPLQSGWELLILPFLSAVRLAPEPASGTSAVWFQLLWVAAAYALLRTLGLPRPRATAWVAVFALGGFFLQNTIFTWPKLAAGAFACGAFGFSILLPRSERTVTTTVIAGTMAALAWLAHGGVAFSFLILAPWIAWESIRGRMPGGARAAMVCIVLVAPWTAYQKLYDPPGNRLLKWHLAGQIAIDPRGVGQTLRENYAAAGWKEVVHDKARNFAALKAGAWMQLPAFPKLNLEDRRAEEFFYLGRTLSWWVLAVIVAPFAWIAAARLPDAGELRRRFLALLIWTLLTIPVWCLLMFGEASSLVHQGSYAVVLSLFVLLATLLEFAGRWSVAIAVIIQSVAFIYTWTGPNRIVTGELDSRALLVVVVAALALAASIVTAFNRGTEPTGEVA